MKEFTLPWPQIEESLEQSQCRFDEHTAQSNYPQTITNHHTITNLRNQTVEPIRLTLPVEASRQEFWIQTWIAGLAGIAGSCWLQDVRKILQLYFKI